MARVIPIGEVRYTPAVAVFEAQPLGQARACPQLAPATHALRGVHRVRLQETLRAAGITRKRDPRVALYLSKVMLDFGETLAPGRRRERLPMQALARVARMLPGPGP